MRPARLRVLVGPSTDCLQDVTSKVNKGSAHDIVSEAFEGRVSVYIDGFNDCEKSEFFERDDRRGTTWSIQAQGRFLQPHSADDILFGCIFERSLILPWGTNVALQFMKFIDPVLDHDISSQKPWALSPLISSMPYFSHTRIPNPQLDNFPPFPPPVSISDDISQLNQALTPDSVSNEKCARDLAMIRKANQRRSYFHKQHARNQISFGPDDIITTDFCYGFFAFNPEIVIRFPGGVSFNIAKYWDGQPVRFVCCERQREKNSQEPWGRIFWCVSIEPEQEQDCTLGLEDDTD